MDNSPNLLLPYIAPSQAQKHVTHNEAIRALDALVQLAVLDRDLSAPPVSPADGQRYLVAAGASGAWAGQSGKIAAFQDGSWEFFAPRAGWTAWVADEALLAVWNGTNWVEAGVYVNPTPFVGVNATAALPNRLMVKSPATLFDHDGAGHQLKLNKAAAAQTGSVLFQDGYSGRAEIGLAGDDDLSVKVSADGSAWSEVMRFDRTSGETIVGKHRVNRGNFANMLPDSGRFNGAGNNAAFSAIAYTAPGYLQAVSGGSLISLAKFINNNTDYGGSGGALDAEVRALLDKVKPAGARRYGMEWYVITATNSASTLADSQTIGGTAYGVVITNGTFAMPAAYTFAYYVKVKTGSAAIAVANAVRAAIDGVAVTAGAGAAPVVLTNADGWKHVNLEMMAGISGTDIRMAQLLTPLSGAVWFAMPKFVFGHMNFDVGTGVLMNSKLFG